MSFVKSHYENMLCFGCTAHFLVTSTCKAQQEKSVKFLKSCFISLYKFVFWVVISNEYFGLFITWIKTFLVAIMYFEKCYTCKKMVSENNIMCTLCRNRIHRLCLK